MGACRAGYAVCRREAALLNQLVALGCRTRSRAGGHLPGPASDAHCVSLPTMLRAENGYGSSSVVFTPVADDSIMGEEAGCMSPSATPPHMLS